MDWDWWDWLYFSGMNLRFIFNSTWYYIISCRVTPTVWRQLILHPAMWVRLNTTPLLLELYLSSIHILHKFCPIYYFCQKLPSSVKEKALIGINNYSLLELRNWKIACKATNLNVAIFVTLGCFSKLCIILSVQIGFLCIYLPHC